MGKKTKDSILHLFREELSENEIPPDDVVGIVGQILSEYSVQFFLNNTRQWPEESVEREKVLPKKPRDSTFHFFRQKLKENEISPEVVVQIMIQILNDNNFQVIKINSQHPPSDRVISGGSDCEPAAQNPGSQAVQTRAIQYRRKECAAFHKLKGDLP